MNRMQAYTVFKREFSLRDTVVLQCT